MVARAPSLLLVTMCTACTAGPVDLGGHDGQLTLRAFDGDGRRAAGAMVHVLLEAGGVHRVLTDSRGEATVPIPDGGATVLLAAGDRGGLVGYAVVGARPGDHLELGRPRPPVGDRGQVTVTVPPNAVQGEGEGISVRSACGSGYAPGGRRTVMVELDLACASDGVQLVARYDRPGALPLFAATSGAAVFAEGAAEIGGDWTAAASRSVEVANLAATTDATETRWVTRLGDVILHEHTFAAAASGQALSVELPAPAFGEHTVELTLREGARSRIGTLPAESDGTVWLDAGEAPPWSAPPAWAADDRTARWAVAEDAAAAADATVVTLSFEAAMGVPVRWNIVAPPGIDAVTLPPMPAGLRNADVPEDAEVVATLAQVTAAGLGYDAVRGAALGANDTTRMTWIAE